jgi:uncharacterized protein (TIRG00374 family)
MICLCKRIAMPPIGSILARQASGFQAKCTRFNWLANAANDRKARTRQESFVNKKKLLLGIGKYVLAFSLLSWVVWQNWSPASGGGIADALNKPMRAAPFIVAAVLYLTGILLTFVRWFVLVRAQDLPFTLWNALRLGMIGFFWSTFLPGSVGGDAVKAYVLAREQSRRTVAVATVLLDRAIGLLGLFWLVAILGTIFWLAGDPCLHNRTLAGLVACSVTLLLASVLTWVLMGFLPEWRAQRFAGRLSRLPKVGHAAAEFWRAIWMYRLKTSYLGGALGLALVGHICFVLAFYFSAQVIGTSDLHPIPTMAEHFLIVPVGMTVQALAPLPGGAGVGELGFQYLYYLVLGTQEAKSQGVLAALVARVISWLLGLVGYIVYLRTKPSLPDEKDLASLETPPEPDGPVDDALPQAPLDPACT